MQTILIIGAGKSSLHLIDYLLETTERKERRIIVADIDKTLADEKTKGHPQAETFSISLESEQERIKLVQLADLVISMLPAFLHPIIARDCLLHNKHFFSASYESDALRKMKEDIEKRELLFLNECGLDPGIDHMSAMRIIDHERSLGHEIISFKSYCGGILSPESEDNPWKYKFTWNPRNVVLAGQGISQFIRNGQLKYIPYHMLFRRLDKVTFEDVGEFDGYANRDSLSYRAVYGLDDVPTMLRGTLRRPGYCQAWDVFVQLGMTDDTVSISLPNKATQRDFLEAFLPYDEQLTAKEKLMKLLPSISVDTLSRVAWLGMFDTVPLAKITGTPASILQEILEKKWGLLPTDRDMIVMQHLLDVKTPQGIKRITSSLVCKGENQQSTAMSKTVGLPLAIAVDLFLDGKLTTRGLVIPTIKSLYEPILDKLQDEGIVFREESQWV